MRGLATALFAAALAPASARAADFYAGKSINLVINFTAGGPTDIEGRLIAKHLAKRVGANVVARNMGGAGGAVAINWLGEIAPRDGLTVGFFTALASRSAVAEPSVRVDAAKFGFVAAGGGLTIGFARTDIPPGLKQPADIMKASDFWIGGLGPESDKDIRMRMQLDMLGLKYRYISNYPGSSEARLALDRGEIQLFTDSIPTYRAAIEPQVAAGKLLPLWHDPVDDGERFSASPDAAGVPAPTFVDFVVKQKGALPSGPMWEAYRVLNVVGTTFLRTLTLPPGAPKEAAESLRAAIDDIDKDPGFGAEAAAVLKFVPRYQTDDNTATLFRKRLAPDPAIVAFLRDYIEKGRERLGK